MNQRDHIPAVPASPATTNDESPSSSTDGSAPARMQSSERLAQDPPFPAAPVAARLRKAQVRAALFRKLEPIKIGRFILLEPLGAGAMGEIYTAYDDQLDRKVALKLVRSGTEVTVKADERLLREAQTLAQVSHPNVVQIYEAGTYDGRLFIAMELIRGKTLSSWLKDVAQLPRPMRQREILRQFIAAGRGLEAAHAAGLAHRDFKPDNVLVGDDGRARVVDFGLARALVDETDGAVSAWSSGALDDDRDGAARSSEPSKGESSLSQAVTSRDREGGDAVTPDRTEILGDGAAGTSPLLTGALTIEYKAVATQAPTSPAATADPLAKTERARTGDERGGAAGNGHPGGVAGEAGGRPREIDPAPDKPTLKAAVRLTETGTVMGTPSYMAPETMRGAIADQRSDQFSFCVALYQALYEAFPFPGKSLWELRDSMESGEVAFAPGVPVPAFVRKVLYRGLSVEPSRRFASMSELLAALEPKARLLRSWIAVAASLIVVAVSAVVVLRSQAPADPCAAAGTAIDAVWSADRQAAIGAASGGSDRSSAGSAWRGVKLRIDSYAGHWRDAATSACQATHIAHTQSAEQLDQRMLCLDRGRRQLAALVGELGAGTASAVEYAIEAAEALPELDACGRAENLLFGLAPPPPSVRAQVSGIRDNIARALTLELLGRYKESLAIARDASALARGLGYPPVYAEALAQTARALDDRGTAATRAEAERLYFEALDIAEAERHDQLAVTIWNQLVTLAGTLDSGTQQAHAWWRRNAAAVRRIGDNAYEQAKLYHARGEIYYREGKYAQAADEERRAIDAISRTPAHQVERSRYDDALAKSLEYLGDLDRALQLHEGALAIASKAYGAASFNVIKLKINYSRALEKRGQNDRARSVLEDALDSIPASDRDAHPDAARIHGFLSELDYVEGHLDSAAEHARASIAIYQGALSPDHVLVAEAYTNLANAEFKRRNFASALDMYENALSLRHRYLVADHYQIGVNEGSLAESLVELGRDDEAMTHLVAAERIFAHSSGKEPWTQVWMLAVRGEILVAKRQFSAAISVLEPALTPSNDRAALPDTRATVMFVLARALHGLNRDASRVRSLAESAHAIFAAQGAQNAHDRDAVARFLGALPAR
jgi:serine/threonine protein kinase/tetratricopeptide (TPR) repeat protein